MGQHTPPAYGILMKYHLPAKTSLLVICLGLFLWSGCANFLKPEMGAVARPEARIALPEQGLKDSVFATGDLKVIYSLAGAGEPFALAGTVVFDRSLVAAFPVIARFFLKLSFLDGEGRVIDNIDITPVFNRRGPAEKLDFRVSRPAPAGSKAIAFNYFGEFLTDNIDSSDTWEISYFPFN